MDKDLARDIWRMLQQPSQDSGIDSVALHAVTRSLDVAPTLQAIWHPLGFIMIRLAKVPEGSLRLHIWPGYYAGGKRASDQVHEHRWALTSYILCGRLKNYIMKVSESSALSTEPSWQLAEITHQATRDYVHPLGVIVTAEVISEAIYGRGERYTLGPRIFHRTEVLVTPCATLVGETTGIGSPSRSMGALDAEANYSTRKIVELTELISVLSEVVERMEH